MRPIHHLPTSLQAHHQHSMDGSRRTVQPGRSTQFPSWIWPRNTTLHVKNNEDREGSYSFACGIHPAEDHGIGAAQEASLDRGFGGLPYTFTNTGSTSLDAWST